VVEIEEDGEVGIDGLGMDDEDAGDDEDEDERKPRGREAGTCEEVQYSPSTPPWLRDAFNALAAECENRSTDGHWASTLYIQSSKRSGHDHPQGPQHIFFSWATR